MKPTTYFAKATENKRKVEVNKDPEAPKTVEIYNLFTVSSLPDGRRGFSSKGFLEGMDIQIFK